MCCEDQHIQAGIDGGMVPLDLTTTTQIALAADKLRRTLVLSAPISGTTTFSPGTPAVAGIGIVLAAGATPVKLTFRSDGNIVTKSWHVIHSAGSVSTGLVIGVMTSDECKR